MNKVITAKFYDTFGVDRIPTFYEIARWLSKAVLVNHNFFYLEKRKGFASVRQDGDEIHVGVEDWNDEFVDMIFWIEEEGCFMLDEIDIEILFFDGGSIH